MNCPLFGVGQRARISWLIRAISLAGRGGRYALAFMAFTSFSPSGKYLFVTLSMESSRQPLHGRRAGCLSFDGIGTASVKRWVVLSARLDVHADSGLPGHLPDRV
jgi:hypothetical protein